MSRTAQAAEARAQALAPEVRRQIETRARALWEACGRPPDRDLDFWLQAEQEVIYQSVAGEEDPLAGVEA
jgi:hypothetical protein